jgi:hypothetical protein
MERSRSLSAEIVSTSKTTVEKIHVRFKHWGWADFFLEDHRPGAGTLVINSDWGCWSYTWTGIGEGLTLASFLLRADNDYIIRKLLLGSKVDEFDAEKTLEQWKERLCDERREGRLAKEQARELWEELEQYADCGVTDSTLFVERLPEQVSEWLGYEAYEYLAHRPSSEYRALDGTLLPALRTVLGAQAPTLVERQDVR